MADQVLVENPDMMDMTAQLAQAGFEKALKYFQNPNAKGVDFNHVQSVLKAAGIHSRLRATRANEAAISVAIAKMTGMDGKHLGPVFEKLTGRKIDLLPEKTDGDDGKS